MAESMLRCTRCGSTPTGVSIFDGCGICKAEGVVANYTTSMDIAGYTSKDLCVSNQPGIWKYRNFYPINSNTSAISLGEGNTPLVHTKRLGEELGIPNLYIKDESRNPTWSHKDRLCSVGITKAVESGAKVITVSSTGNHGASTAAYAARAGLPCVVFTTVTVPQTMKTLMQSYGALLVATPTPRDRWTLMERCVKDFGWYALSGYVFPPLGSNPFAIDGYKSIAFEIFEQLGRIPEKVIVPTAYGDALIGIWKGFLDLQKIYNLGKLPQMIAVEPYGAYVQTLDTHSQLPVKVSGENSAAFAIAVNISTYQGLKVLWDSNGYGCAVNDCQSMKMQLRLASTEGLFAEPSSTIAIAGIPELLAKGKMSSEDTVVVVLTSTGLKDPEVVEQSLPPTPIVQPNIDDLRCVLKKSYQFEL